MALTMDASSTYIEKFVRNVEDRTLTAGVIGLGYVGLPLAQLFTSCGFKVIGLDIDVSKTRRLMSGESYIGHIPSAVIRQMRQDGRFEASSQFAKAASTDALSICVPTPLDKFHQPDLTAIRQTAHSLVPHLRPGQLIILESTTYPGTTTEVLLPILEQSGLKVGDEIFVGFSPEREDPANPQFTARSIPKVVGANDAASRQALKAFYGAVFDRIVPVSCCEAAEMTKILENIYRCVNIALVNELKQLCMRMGIDIHEVIDAAKTKPFGFQAFYPGPGLGGHCIPIDPFYLSWKAKKYDFRTRFIELAGEVNTAMPYFVIDQVAAGLNEHSKSIKGSKVLVLGLAYKRDIDDLRESPSLTIIELLREKGAFVSYNDPFFPNVGRGRHYDLNMTNTPLDQIDDFDAVVIVTDHSAYDYRSIVEQSRLVIDTRNATKGIDSPKIVRC